MKSERLQIRVTPEQKAKLQQLAESKGRTVSNYIDYLIREDIKRSERMDETSSPGEHA